MPQYVTQLSLIACNCRELYWYKTNPEAVAASNTCITHRHKWLQWKTEKSAFGPLGDISGLCDWLQNKIRVNWTLIRKDWMPFFVVLRMTDIAYMTSSSVLCFLNEVKFIHAHASLKWRLVISVIWDRKGSYQSMWIRKGYGVLLYFCKKYRALT